MAETDIVAHYYDALFFQTDYITFAPLQEPVPDFSWLLAFALGKDAPYAALVAAAQQEMRDILFRRVDFSRTTKVLDFGCGYGSDLLRMAQAHPHLVLHGYNRSPQQVELARQKITTAGVAERVTIALADSTRDAFPDRYDLVFGIEVAGHIANKADLFTNIAQHLNNGGYLLLADLVAQTLSPIAHEATSSYIPTREQIGLLLAAQRLRIVECIDVSREIATFFDDPLFDEHLAQVSTGMDAVVRESLQSYDNTGRMLRAGLLGYCLLIIQKDSYTNPASIQADNVARLTAPTPYAVATGRISASAAATGVQHAHDTREQSAFVQQLTDALPAQRSGLLVARIQAEIASVLEIDNPHTIDPQRGFFQMGLSSLMYVAFMGRLEIILNQPLPATLALEYPTVEQLTRYVLDTVLHLAPPEQVQQANPTAPAAAQPDTTPSDDDLEQMSQEDMLAMLAAKLSDLENRKKSQ